MKVIILLAIVLLSYGCSKESNIENITNSDINPSTEKRAQLTTSDVIEKYIGVFGHNTNRELHGKIVVSHISRESYRATISLVNGDVYAFTSTTKIKNNLYFEGVAGSFEFNIDNQDNPIASNVYIASETPGYISIVKRTKLADPIVVLGTYEETGNEANFYGNWDLIGELYVPFSSANKQGPQLNLYSITKAIVSHKNNVVMEDVIMELYQDPSTCYFTYEFPDIRIGLNENDPTFYNVFLRSYEQTSLFAGHIASWEIESNFTSNGFEEYGSNNCGLTTSGFWSWNGKSGVIYHAGTFNP